MLKILIDKFNSFTIETKIVLCLFVPLCALSFIVSRCDGPSVKNTLTFSQPPPIKGTNVPKVEVAVAKGKVKVIPKRVATAVIKDLPTEVVDDKDEEITATAEVPASENGTKVISTINTETGESKIFIKENPAPYFAFEAKKRVGVGYGIGQNGTEAKVFSEVSFIRVGNVHLGVQVEVSANAVNGPSFKIQAVADYRW